MTGSPYPTGVAVLGATGSIGASTLDVIARHPEQYRVSALSANRDVDGMAALCRRFRPALVTMADPQAAAALRDRLDDLTGIRVSDGPAGQIEAATHSDADTVVAGIVGAAGLAPCLAAVETGKRVLIANKEALVVAGSLIMAAAQTSGAMLLPIDSEHNGIFQCLPDRPGQAIALTGVERLILTASGGPFRDRDPATLAAVTVEEACAHPNWSMGRKISVDSATMMNKGLELIEACRFFGMPAEQVDIVVHPQSLIHALVQYRDGTTLAQMGNPDMRTPIANALAWPERIDAGVNRLDLVRAGRLDFAAPDDQRFPCLGLARAALDAGSGATAALNGANEVAVAEFLDGGLRYDRIAAVIEDTLAALPAAPDETLEALIAHEQWARRQAADSLRRWRHR
ncbi:1-deoxy-D-xylulose-5-phosphate reductoisomerase [Spiribacter vilamensis]|uniref:1-deoxy-D-xylulose 5-phosphate reductoisomerase n=1 Tax=Spiribacter vilamensis TaxID=531306 RepID=A0A4Q8CZP2_9GAMM|nr:1-deoxy-D-xylulose-5-phosphate reductoisomerase [Spiribacter vilamensis]RZU98452.1 1-deoxy-D-xylulose 5-phosphate reductoisomerase [Spiribacter vilamensis]TVO60674.1 1-deoxy-D-xylulose-5-phosphate reductoisomerase [Spiribacter vilamensis]